MTEKVRIGVIGLGIMGEQYVRIYQAHPLATVTAVCTRDAKKVEEIGDKARRRVALHRLSRDARRGIV